MQSLAKLAVGKDSYKLKVVLLEMDGFHWCRNWLDAPFTRETHLHVRKVTYDHRHVRSLSRVQLVFGG